MTDPLRYAHQAAVHQLKHCAEDIQAGDGLLLDWDYDEELEIDYLDPQRMNAHSKRRTVTLELTYLLPE